MLKRTLSVTLLLLLIACAADKRSFTVRSSDIPWADMKIDGFPPGLQQRLLHDNTENKLSSAIVRYPKGFREPRHYHTTCGHSIYILKGHLKAPDGDLLPGDFTYAAINERHGPYIAVEETEILFYTDGPFDMKIEDTKE